jgi:hypothetical protein
VSSRSNQKLQNAYNQGHEREKTVAGLSQNFTGDTKLNGVNPQNSWSVSRNSNRWSGKEREETVVLHCKAWYQNLRRTKISNENPQNTLSQGQWSMSDNSYEYIIIFVDLNLPMQKKKLNHALIKFTSCAHVDVKVTKNARTTFMVLHYIPPLTISNKNRPAEFSAFVHPLSCPLQDGVLTKFLVTSSR